MNADPSTKRPGGRSTHVRAAVHSAAVALVGEFGADQVTLPAVARRAGVNSSTLYRRWGTLAALLASVAAVLARPRSSATCAPTWRTRRSGH